MATSDAELGSATKSANGSNHVQLKSGHFLRIRKRTREKAVRGCCEYVEGGQLGDMFTFHSHDLVYLTIAGPFLGIEK